MYVNGRPPPQSVGQKVFHHSTPKLLSLRRKSLPQLQAVSALSAGHISSRASAISVKLLGRPSGSACRQAWHHSFKPRGNSRSELTAFKEGKKNPTTHTPTIIKGVRPHTPLTSGGRVSKTTCFEVLFEFIKWKGVHLHPLS